jgi:hypothetical protein
LSPSSWSCTATQLHTRQKKATAATIAFFVELRCNATPHQEEEEGDDNNTAIAFFFFFFSYNTKKKKKKVTTTLMPSPSFAPLRCSTTKQALQRNVTFFDMLRCSAAP